MIPIESQEKDLGKLTEFLLKFDVRYDTIDLGQVPKSNQKAKVLSGWLTHPKGGEAMSVYETIMVILGALTVFIALITLMIVIADKFSQRK